MTDPIEEVSFDECLELTKGLTRDLLLGNGFSIAAHPSFNYGRLLERASIPHEVANIFASSRTSNFEAVMRILLVEAMAKRPGAAQEACRKVEALKASCALTNTPPAPKKSGRP